METFNFINALPFSPNLLVGSGLSGKAGMSTAFLSVLPANNWSSDFVGKNEGYGVVGRCGSGREGVEVDRKSLLSRKLNGFSILLSSLCVVGVARSIVSFEESEDCSWGLPCMLDGGVIGFTVLDCQVQHDETNALTPVS